MALHEYECPACGGAMEFNPHTQKLKCPYCDSEFDVKDYVANHNSNSTGEAADEYNSSAQVDENAQPLYIYKCGSCGGEILATESLGSTKCPFCSNNVVVSEKFTGEFKPDYIIPFKHTREDAMETYKKYVKSKKLVPSVFLAENHIDELRGVYVPFWLYNATESFDGAYEGTTTRTWRDSQYIYTETKFYDVRRSGTETFENVPVDGSKEMPDDLMESLEPFDHNEMVPFNMGYLAGFLANKYNVPSKDCKPRAIQRMNATLVADFRKTMSKYSSLRTLSENTGIVESSDKYALYPVYMLNTSWNGKNYLFAMNGQSGKFVGNLPCSYLKALKYYIPISAIASLIAFIIYYFVIL
jgi:DNA-directed RNA polymerase subunit RPC12/RpoP